MKIYKILDLKNSHGKWLEEYEVPENFPVENGWTTVVPDSSLKFPKWDYMSGSWIEDKDSVIDSLKLVNGELTDRINMTENALLDLADMILSK